MSLRCRLFGHKWDDREINPHKDKNCGYQQVCVRCNIFGEKVTPEDNCLHHHWGEWCERNNWSIYQYNDGVYIERREVRKCQHSECDEYEKRDERRVAVPKDVWLDHVEEMSEWEEDDDE